MKYWMALRGIQEYIARDANNIARWQYILVSPEKEPSNHIIIYIGLCESSYYLAIVSDCQLPFFLFTNSAHGVRPCVERSSSGNIQVTEYSPGNNVSERAQIYVDNIMAFLVINRVEYAILFWPLKALYE